ncbi:MAG: TIGR02186 family protein [Beijerinckiaceae bacterium]|nr:TIGR02186 family protein [Beijerinckiaceae bacterium]
MRRAGRVLLGLTALAALLAPAASARAQSLVASLSTDNVPILSNFTGERIAVFGVIDPGAAPRPKDGYDIVVSVRGPRGAVTVRRKERWALMWLNLDARRYIAIPSFISIVSNRPLERIAQAEVRDDLRIGVDALIPPQTAVRGANDPVFRDALQRIRREQGLFLEDNDSVRFITPTVFQAQIELPGAVPLGGYDVEVALFSDGALAARTSLKFAVSKYAVEQWVAEAAHRTPILYGAATSLMALLIGWLASVVFRRD